MSDEARSAVERGWRDLDAVDAALARGEIDEAGWHAAVLAIVEPAYLSAGTPQGQSGHSGDARRWEEARRPLLAAVQPPVEVSGEPVSFDDFYRREHRRVLGLAFVLTGNVAAAEDVTQDAFTAAFRNWHFVAACDSPGAWVRRVTCNRAASVLRRRLAEAKAVMRLAKRTQTSIELDEGDEAFWQAVRRLPPRQAQAVALYYFEGLTLADIGKVLGVTESRISQVHSRATSTLRAKLVALESA